MSKEIIKRVIPALIILGFIGWCSMPDKEIEASEIIRVSDYEFSMTGLEGDGKAVSIVFGESDENYCDATFYRTDVKAAFRVLSERSDKYKEISFQCQWDGVLYVSSSNHPTFIEFEMISIDQANKIAEAEISAKLVDYDRVRKNQTDKFAELDSIRLVITGQHFDNLMKQM